MKSSNTQVILIHGLARKLPRQKLQQLWTEVLLAGVGDIISSDDIQMAYWADCLPSHISHQIKPSHRQAVQDLLDYRQKHQSDFHVGTGEKIAAFFAEKGVELVDILSSALTLKDNILKAYFKEIRVYVDSLYLSRKIRRCVISKVVDAWQQGKKVVIVCHSMGSFVAYDALWQLSRHHEYRHYHTQKVEALFTLGSPLGNSGIQDILLSAGYHDEQQSFYPTNIKSWYNFACLGDVVTHGADMNKAYLEPMKKMSLLQDFRNYQNLYNPYTCSGHLNPHKSYGYLVQPKFSKWLSKILLRN